MLEQVGMAQGLDILFQKLGHHLPEIRSRALSSILSKLEHGLLHESNLVQERQLFIKLLEWFNFHPAPMTEEVFKLLFMLSKHTHAQELLVSLGAIQFLTDLRSDVSHFSRGDLDNVLENLLHSTENVHPGDRCMYQSTDTTQGIDNVLEHGVNRGPDMVSGYFEDPGENRDHVQRNIVMGQEDTSSFITYPGFPWHFLTATDRHVVSSTSVSLCSSNTLLIHNACSFLLDVVLRDFPTEIFLQRPTIVNTLLTLLRSRPGADLMSIACECLSYIASNLLARILFFQDPNFHCPRQGLPLRQGSLFDSGHIPQYSTVDDTGGHERNGGDGRDENSSSSISSTFTSAIQQFEETDNRDVVNDEDDSLEDDNMVALQMAQLSTHDFCISCLQTAVPLLLVESSTLFLRAYEISINCIQVLGHILDRDVLWEAEQTSAINFQADIESISKILSRAVLYHYHMESRELPKKSQAMGTPSENDTGWSIKLKSKHEFEFHRVAYQACSNLFTEFLKTVLPVKRCQRIGTDSSTTALYVIACDEPLQIASPACKDAAKLYLAQGSEEKNEVLLKLKVVLQSVTDMHHFLDARKSEDKGTELMLKLAKSALNALPYYTVDDFVPVLIDVISEVCSAVSNTHCGAARGILLELLAHPFVNVRSKTYQSCFKVTSASVSVALATENPSGTGSYKCAFLMSSPVLYEIILHGLSDSSPLVNSPAQDLILCLIRSKLLMKEDLWQKLECTIKPVMSVLQTFMGGDELLRRAVFEFVKHNFDYFDTLQFLLRCLLLKQRSVRVVASEMIPKIMGAYRKELRGDDKEKLVDKLLDYAANIVDMTDLLMIDKPLSLASSPLSGATAVDSGLFHEDAVVRMLGIFRSRTISWPVRRSALQQLSVILNDKNMHNTFLKSDGLETVKSHMLTLATNSVLTDVENSEALSCIAIVKAVAIWNRDLRKSMTEPSVYLALLKLLDLCRLFPVTTNLVAQTIALFLLDDVLHQKEEVCQQGSSEPSLPSRVLSHYQIPFLCSVHDVISKNRIVPSPPSHCDPLLSGPAAFAITIRIAFTQNNGDVRGAIESSRSQLGSYEVPDEGLSARSHSSKLIAEQIAMIHSHASTAVEQMVSTIQKASAHAAVSHALSLIRILLKSSPEQFSCVMYKSSSWRNVVEKFLQVLPSSSRDMDLLWDVVGMLGDLVGIVPSIKFDFPDSADFQTENVEDTLLWFLRMCVPEGPTAGLHVKEMPLFALLQTSEVHGEQNTRTVLSVTLQRQLCKSILSMVSFISRRINVIRDNEIVYRFQSVLCQIILLRLKLADTPRFYDLPSMEVTLDCLVHNTASTGWTNLKARIDKGVPDGSTLCTQLLSSLLEVVSAFHIENRGSSMSYMGKGVSKSATRGIVHLVFELATKMKETPGQIPGWLSVIARTLILEDTKDDDNLSSRIEKASFEWILALWSARDPRIRYSGLALGVALTTTSTGCALIKNNFHKYGGIWSATFSVLFDSTECSAVRAQAAALLCNLIYHNFKPGGSGDLVAFVRLLNKFKFSQSILVLISRYHSNYLIQPVTIVYTPFLSSASTSTSETSFQSGTERSEGNQYQPGTRAQVQRHRIGQLSENSYNSDMPPEWQAVCTPVLVTAICRLLRNTLEVSKDAMIMLLRDAVVDQIAHMVDFSVLMSYIDECKSKSEDCNVTKGRLSLTATSLIEQYSETCKMLHVYAAQEKGAAASLLNNTELLSSFVSLITIVIPDQLWCERVLRMRQSAMDLLSCILFQCKSQASTVITQVISNCWPSFSVTIQHALLLKDEDYLLSLMTMLSNLLTSQIVFSKEKHVTLLTSFDHPSAESDMMIFCTSLVEIFESYMVKKDRKNMEALIKCADTLQAFFTTFPTTKNKAYECGFLENVIEEVKLLHSRLELLAINEKCMSGNLKTADNTTQGTAEFLVNKLLVLSRLLGSFIRETSEIQTSAANLGLGYMLEKWWSWVIVFPKFKSSILKLATCFTCNSDQACCSISVSTPGHQPFVHCLISEVQELNNKVLIARRVQPLHLQTVYQLLNNLAISRECRSLLWKSGFMKEFTTVADRGQHPKSTKQQRLLLFYWLKMFYSLSYFTDGQLNILKITDILEILSSISNSTNHSEIVMKILCNLCYHGHSKARISSNKAALDMLAKGMTSQYSAVSAIWALLSCSQKAKVHLKVAGLASKIHSALACANQKVPEEQDGDVQYRLTAILDIIQT